MHWGTPKPPRGTRIEGELLKKVMFLSVVLVYWLPMFYWKKTHVGQRPKPIGSLRILARNQPGSKNGEQYWTCSIFLWFETVKNSHCMFFLDNFLSSNLPFRSC